MYSAESEALRAMVPGPYEWCVKKDLFILATHYGQARDFANLDHLSLAARARLRTCEYSSRGGLDIDRKCKAIKDAALASSQPLDRQRLWANWFTDGTLVHIQESKQQLELQGLPLKDLWEKAAGAWDPDEDLGSRNKRARRSLQKTIRKALHNKIRSDPVNRMRCKLDRWNLPETLQVNLSVV